MPIRAQDSRPKQSTADTAAHLFEEAQTRLDFDDYPAALDLFQQAASSEPQNQEYLSAYGSLLAEVGKSEDAIRVLQGGVQQFPDEGFEKYMYLGQLLQGEEAIQNLQNGIEILQREANQTVDRAEASELRAQLASGLCSLAEMHMASNREVAEVGATCELLLARARQADSHSPEPLQVLASLRNEQGRPDKALELLRQSMGLWFRRPLPGGAEAAAPQEAGLQNEVEEAEEEAQEEADRMQQDLATPSFEFRFETAKLLIELDETTDDAIQILEELLAENDQAIDVWYLLGMCQHAGGDDESALATLEEGEALAARVGIPATDPSAVGFAQLKERVQTALRQAAAGAKTNGMQG